jgi:hypothetical protein
MKTDAVANHAVRNQPPVQKNATQPVANDNATKPTKEAPKPTENNATQQNNAAGQINITA